MSFNNEDEDYRKRLHVAAAKLKKEKGAAWVEEIGGFSSVLEMLHEETQRKNEERRSTSKETIEKIWGNFVEEWGDKTPTLVASGFFDELKEKREVFLEKLEEDRKAVKEKLKE